MRKNLPDKVRARQLMTIAIRKGHVVRGCCEVCGLPEAEGHHTDYNFPLKVMWLCREHHRKWHVENPKVPGFSNLRSVPVEEEFHRKAKVIASLEGMSISDWVEWAIDKGYQAAMHNRGRRARA